MNWYIYQENRLLKTIARRPVGRRKRVPVFMVVETGKHYAVPVLVRNDGPRQFDRAGTRAAKEDHVRYRAVLHHVMHDQRWVRQRRVGDGQREDIHYLHDGYCV